MKRKVQNHILALQILTECYHDAKKAEQIINRLKELQYASK